MIAQAVKVQRLIEEEQAAPASTRTPHLRQELRERYDFSNIIGTSGPMRQMYEQVAQVAAHQHDGADPRRVGHRQGADRARDPLQLAAREEAVHQGELRRAARQPDRVGAVRLREGRVHRRASSARRGGSSSPKAARCSSTRSATSTSATQVKLLRVLQEREFERLGGTETIKVERAPGRRDEQGPREGDRRRHVPRGPVLPAERVHDLRAAAARAEGRPAAARRPLPREVLARAQARTSSASRRPRSTC